MAGGVELATAYVSLVVSGDKVAPGVRQALGGADAEAGRAGDKAGRSFSSRFGRSLKVGAGIAAGFAAVKGVQFLGDAVESASDLGESLNAVNVTFGESARGVKRLGRDAANALGLSNTEFNGLAVQFSAFSEIIAGKGGDVVGTLDELTTRGADFASVMNLDVSEAMRLFQSGLAGETEPLRKFGIDLSAAAVTAHAYAEGIAETDKKLTEAQKVQARYSLLMKQTEKTAGDFTNTSDGLANSQRRLGAQWEDLKAQIGTELLPVVERLSNWVADEALPAMSGFFDEMKRGKGFGGDVAEALGTVRDVLGKVVPLAKDFIGAFADMPKWAQTALVGGGAAALLGGKLKGGALGGLVSKASPVPVFVTNMGAGGLGGGAAAGKGKGGIPLVVGQGAALTAAAALVSAIGTKFIMDLQQRVAPKAYDQGIAGTPNFGTGLAGMFGDDPAGKAGLFTGKLREMVETFEALRGATEGFSGTFAEYDKSLAAHIRSNPEQGFKALELYADQAGVSVETLTSLLPKSARAIDKTGVSVETTESKTHDWLETILGTGREIDNVGKKRPRVPFEFPGLLAGINDANRLDQALDEATKNRTVIITILERVVGDLNPFDGGSSSSSSSSSKTAPPAPPKRSGSGMSEREAEVLGRAVYAGARAGIAERGMSAYAGRRVGG